MNKQDLSGFLETNINIDLPDFILNLIVVGVLCYLIKIFYKKFSTTLSNREEFSKNFILLGIATCIVITIVKNSLALSLGLVGALSIVRFRAAIKEPEELVYLFLVIATGLGGGAGQIKITISGMAIGLIIIYLSSLRSEKNIKNNQIINLGIIIEKKIGDKEINQILDDAKNISQELKFISMSKTNSDVSINLDIKPKKFQQLSKFSDLINKKFPNSKVIISQNNDLAI
tara:strand:- start:453 stop:1142 length:690 start_codon:yes stop_codon:yes gene_type:complete